MVKRKNCAWDTTDDDWLKNALMENERYHFHRIMARENPEHNPSILVEADLENAPCPGWDTPHGVTVNRKAQDMAAAVNMMLGCCRWVKFIDPYFVKCKKGHKKSLPTFLKILGAERPVGPPETIEIHTSRDGATTEFLKEFYEKIIPTNLQVILYRWQERPSGQKLHNRYILTDLGGVSFQHGLDTGTDGETDDISRLDIDQYLLRCKQYDPASLAFDQGASPITINGNQEE